jgi:hypothetical protein
MRIVTVVVLLLATLQTIMTMQDVGQSQTKKRDVVRLQPLLLSHLHPIYLLSFKKYSQILMRFGLSGQTAASN